MTTMLGVERPFSADSILSTGDNYRMIAGVTGATIPPTAIGTTPLTTVTATIHCASIVLPQNLPLRSVTTIITTAGTVTGLWVAVLDAALIVRAVSANTTAPLAGFFTQSVLPAGLVPAVTSYSGLFYIAVGTVSSVAPQIAAQAAAPSVLAVSGPPVYCGTSSTAATVTPPIVGAQLGALTGVASNQFYAHLL